MKRKKVVMVGGGTGTFVVLSGLKQYDVDLTAIVSMADSGGSTGRLRDEFGFLPVGDLRQALAALAKENDQSWIRELLLYRFSKGSGLEGHNLGNLILTALQDMAGSTPKALEIVGKIFRLEGKIYPITTRKVDLVVEYVDGTFIIGEHHLNPDEAGGKKIKRIRLSPRAKIYPKAKESIELADLVVIGPGDLYASILPNLVVSGAKKAFRKTKAKIVYVVNLMTRYTQTHGFTANDHVEEIREYLGSYPDYVVVNKGTIPNFVLKRYKKDHEFPVENDLREGKFKVIEAALAKVAEAKRERGDRIKRSYLRHNPEKLAKIFLRMTES